MTGPESGDLLEVLEEARALGLLGPGPVERQVEHTLDLASIIGDHSGRVLDLGSGGGLPGLVLFVRWPAASGVLLDAQRRRCAFLERSASTLGIDDRVEVRCGRAEQLARAPALRGAFDLVVARSFGPPAVTAECAVGFLRVGGELVVTEPPEAEVEDRWPSAGLAELGLGPATARRRGSTAAVRMELVRAVDDRWPRRDGMPAKRPRW
jgi:16S rRNA (guanine527-N7)-methyltransferase